LNQDEICTWLHLAWDKCQHNTAKSELTLTKLEPLRESLLLWNYPQLSAMITKAQKHCNQHPAKNLEKILLTILSKQNDFHPAIIEYALYSPSFIEVCHIDYPKATQLLIAEQQALSVSLTPSQKPISLITLHTLGKQLSGESFATPPSLRRCHSAPTLSTKAHEYSSLQAATISRRLTDYINRIERHVLPNNNFAFGFRFFCGAQAINRQANYQLAIQ